MEELFPAAAEAKVEFTPVSPDIEQTTAAKTTALQAQEIELLRSEKYPEIAGHEILAVLGRGGMGVVYKARQIKLNRLVALKMIRSAADASREELARFRIEAEAVARLQHPNVIQIYEVGEHGGQPFFSLELVDGGSLAGVLSGTPLPPRRAAALLEAVSRGMHAAHEHEILHRDLKPANVLMTSVGTPKITDFGLAKQMDADSGETRSGTVIGTPSYMAPEQAAGYTHALDARTDVYALGAILYEALTGRPPFKGATVLDTLWQVRHEEPVPPSRLNSQVPIDVETICLKCLQKEPVQRYAGADALADDLLRFLEGLPIQARPVGAGERLLKWARRRPGVAVLAVLLLVLTVASLAAILGQLRLTELARRDANENATNYRTASEEAETQATLALTEAKRAGQEAENARQAQMNEHRNLYVAHMNLVQRHWEQAEVTAALDLLKRHIPRPGQPDNRGFEWYYFWQLLHNEEHALKDLPGSVRSLRFARRGGPLAIACEDGSLLLWDSVTRKPPVVLSKEAQPVVAVAFSPDGQTLACATAQTGEPGLVKLWDLTSRKEKFVLKGHKHPVMALAFRPDGKMLASGSAELKRSSYGSPFDAHQLGFAGARAQEDPSFFNREGEIKLWDPATGTEPPGPPIEPSPGPVLSLVFYGDGDSLIAGIGGEGDVKVFDLSTKTQVGRYYTGKGPVWSLAVHPDRRTLAMGAGKWTSSAFDTRLGKLEARRMIFAGSLAHPAAVIACTFSPDGKTLATADLNRHVRLWDWEMPDSLGAIKGHTDAVQGLAFSPDGRFLATGGWDRSIKLWDLEFAREWLTLKATTYGHQDIEFSPDSTSLRVDNKLFDARSTALRAVSLEGSYRFLHDGRLVVISRYFRYEQGQFVAWSADKGPNEPFCRIPVGKNTWTFLSPNGKYLLTFRSKEGESAPQETKLWDVAQAQEHVSLALGDCGGPQPHSRFRALKFSPDSKLVVAADWFSKLTVGDVNTGSLLAQRQSSANLTSMAFTPDSKILITGGDDGAIRLWELPSLRELAVMRCANRGITLFAVACAGDGRTIAAGDRMGHIFLWDAATREERLTIRAGSGQIQELAFSPDGRTLAASRRDEVILFCGARAEDVREPGTNRSLDPTGRDLAWRRRQAETARQAGHWADVVAHTTILLERNPEFGYWWLERSAAHYELKEYEKGQADFAKAVALRCVRWDYWCQHALAFLARKDRQGFARDCSALLAHIEKSDDSEASVQVAYVCSLTPDATVDREAVVRLARKVQESHPKNFAVARAYGAALLRAGKWAEAAAQLEAALKLHSESPDVWLLLALAGHRLDRPDDARRWLDKAIQYHIQATTGFEGPTRKKWDSLPWDYRLSVELLLAEAEGGVGQK